VIIAYGVSNVLPSLLIEAALFLNAMRWLILVNQHSGLKKGWVNTLLKYSFFTILVAVIGFFLFNIIEFIITLVTYENILVF